MQLTQWLLSNEWDMKIIDSCIDSNIKRHACSVAVIVTMSGAGGGKRPSGGDSPPGPPEKKSKKEEKTTTTLIEPIRIAGVSSTVSHWFACVCIIICDGCFVTKQHSLFVTVMVQKLCRRKWTWRSSSSKIRSCVSAWNRDRQWRMNCVRKLKN